jgi:hypothetical protein
VTVLVTLEAVVIALLAVLVAGLLRSHAEILRKLHALGMSPDATAGAGMEMPVQLGRTAAHGRDAGHDLGGHDGIAVPRQNETAAYDISGPTPADEAVSIAVAPARVDTLLAFLSSGCTTCATFWDTFQDERRLGLPPDCRLVIVTRGAGAESPARLRRLSPPHVPVIMSDEAWEDYEVPGSPYFIYVDGHAGRVTGEGSAATWTEVVGLLRDALDDGVLRGGHNDGNNREARADRALLAAGITPGDPRLHLPTPATGSTDRSPQA